jgi:outer membrane protein assembly factor BamD (BamD/ComL family)
MKKIINLCLITLFILTGCKSNSDNKDKEIFEEASQMFKDQKFPMAVVQFEKIVKEYPKGDYYPKSLFELGKIYNAKLITTLDGKINLERAVYYFKKLYNEFPASTYAEQALFLTGFLYANELKYLDSAKITYNTFLEKFPNSQFVKSVKSELENMGKSPEEIINKKESN